MQRENRNSTDLGLSYARLRPLALQIARFGLSTGFSAAVSFGLPVILHETFDIGQKRAVAIGFVLAYVANLLLLKTFVFQSRGSWRREVPRYVVVNGTFRLLEYAAFTLLLDRLDWDYRVAVLSVLAVSAVIKFFVYRVIFDSRVE